MAVISHDGMARTELHRETVRVDERDGCYSCSCLNGKPGKRRLYRYGTQAEGINTRVNWHKGLFCGKPCHDAYHG